MGDKYVLYNEEDFTLVIQEPIRQSSRIKYTCCDASEKYLVFAATSGSLYIFNRDPCTFVKILPSKLGSISQVRISVHERLIAFSNVKGQIGIVDLQAADPQVITTQLERSYVTSFYWESEEKLVVGDQKGHVSVINLGYFMGRNILNVTLRSILLLDSPIVQIDGADELLLISTYSKCVLCNTEVEEFKQIGNRPRDGEYGGCFYVTKDDFGTLTRIYCARPGCRLWEVDLDGNVKHTHQFKSALSVPPAKPYPRLESTLVATTDTKKTEQKSSNGKINHQDNNQQKYHLLPSSSDTMDHDDSQQSTTDVSPSNTFHFAKLINFMEKFVLTYSDSKFYILDPTCRVILWSNHFNNIQSVHTVNSKIIIFTSSANLITVDCCTMQDYVMKEFHYGLYLKAANSINAHMTYFIDTVKKSHELHQLYKLKQILEDLDEVQLAKDLQKFFDEIFARNNEMVQRSMRLNNGIYILDNQFMASGKVKRISISDKTPSESTGINIKDALVSAYDVYGKNLKHMIKGLKTLNLESGHLNGKSEQQKVNEIEKTNQTRIDKGSPNQNASNSDNDSIIEPPVVTRRSTHTQLEFSVTEEENIVRSLYLIYKSSKISNLNFLDRYSMLFDRYDTRHIIILLEKLKQVIMENDDEEEGEANRDCIKMYFDYLNPEIIYELDDECRNFIKECFMTVNEINTADGPVVVRCDKCEFPLKPVRSVCRYPKIGVTLLQYYWSRKDPDTCYAIAKVVPEMLDQICKFYIQEKRMDKVIQFIGNLANQELLLKAADMYDIDAWRRTFEIYSRLLQDQNLNCLNCDQLCRVQKSFYDTNLFYTFNHIFATASNYLNGRVILDLLLSYSDKIPNGALTKEIYLNCLLNS